MQKIGFTGENPEISPLTRSKYLTWRDGDRHFLGFAGSSVYFCGSKLCGLNGFSADDLTVGRSVGILLSKDRYLHWFVDDQWRGVVDLDYYYPLDEPMWGVVDVYGRCKKIRAEICTGESHGSNYIPALSE